MKNFRKSAALLMTVITLFAMLAFSPSAADASIKRTKTAASNRLNTVISRLNNTYFTTTAKAVYKNRDYTCRNSNVIQTQWFKNRMGMVPNSASLMPEHYYSQTGYVTSDAFSCAGFANYVLWYIYANSPSDNVRRVNVYTGYFNKANLDRAGLWPGDVIRINDYHSMIYISHSSSGVKVLDSNWNYDNKVNVHEISYSWSKGANKTMACTRGKNYSTSGEYTPSPSTPSNTVTYFSTNIRMKSGSYTNAYSNYNLSSKVGRVYPGDVIRITRVYSNGVAMLSCPWGNYTKTVYCKINQLTFKATKYINAYNSSGSYIGRVYPNDVVSLKSISSNSKVVGSCPWSGGSYKTVYLYGSSIY